MTKLERSNAIKKIVKELGIEGRKSYSVKELNEIATKAKCDSFDVMCVLRYGKIL